VALPSTTTADIFEDTIQPTLFLLQLIYRSVFFVGGHIARARLAVAYRRLNRRLCDGVAVCDNATLPCRFASTIHAISRRATFVFVLPDPSKRVLRRGLIRVSEPGSADLLRPIRAGLRRWCCMF
jgi:hypothetical protein